MSKTSNLLVLCLLTALPSMAQQFLPPVERFSSKKPAYLITTKGERIDFELDDLDRKKGLIVRVEGKSTEGKKFKYEAEDIKEMGLTPSDFAKFNSVMESTRSVAKIQRTQVNEATRNLVLFYQEYLADKDRTVLVQLVNPGFESKIRVYDDPYAAETAGIGFAGVQMTGGMDKSFYVKWNGKVFRLKKKDYDDKFKEFFISCPELLKKYPNFAWRDFAEHVFFFDQNCQ